MDKSSKSHSASNARSPPAAKLERISRTSPSEVKPLGFKPYETNVITNRKPTSCEDARPTSKTSVQSASGGGFDNNNSSSASACDITNDNVKKSHSNNNMSGSSSRTTPLGRKSASPATITQQQQQQHSADRRTPSSSSSEREKLSSESPRNSSGASPIIRSGMEILSGHAAAGGAKDLSAYKPGLSGYPGAANPLCCPPGMQENPAFRPPFAGASPFSHHHAAAAALLGYPSAVQAANASPYLNYARVKTPSGGETLVPVCKDPFCTGCQYSMHNAQMMMGASGPCPGGCTQCDHQKYGLAMALSSLGPMPPPSLSYPGASLAGGGGRPYVCNWITGESYCGKRFTTSDELLQHLRNHTSIAGSDHAAASAALLNNPHTHPLLSPSAALHRATAAAAAAAGGNGYPQPSLSPLSARYHPYGKPPNAAGPLPPSLAASPYSAFNALGPYYSPYAIYGQRIGAAVHP